MKPCLRCGMSLDEADLDAARLTVHCRCGLEYSVELVEQTSDADWMAMFREDGCRIEDNGGRALTVVRIDK